LALSDVLHVSSIKVIMIFAALLEKVGVKVSFESVKIVMTKIMFLWRRDIVIKVFFVLNTYEVINEFGSLAYIFFLMMYGMLD